ncbi:hypothetical protein NliqN6_6654 [Naganishia liquefaciens]|uniref:YqaE/Pmp3 family membrane protein n=1 Tax=Naganishia liquefaciens TaxID=104408 RepID=A0A8H3YJK2_9TREE|nr:hypothetical protein NliqN6_6654 [Naganishia liquefaciens]
MVRSSDVLLIIVAILFPPAAVFMISGCTCDLLINICLTLLGYFPGHIHAFYLIYKKMQAEERYGPAGYTYLGNGQYGEHAHGAPAQAPQPNYGAA